MEATEKETQFFLFKNKRGEEWEAGEQEEEWEKLITRHKLVRARSESATEKTRCFFEEKNKIKPKLLSWKTAGL